MSDIIEVALISDSNGSPWSTAVYDIRTGTNLMSYKGGGAVGAHGLSLIRNEFLVSSNSTKPLLHIWPINKQDQIQSSRFVMPGKVSSLAISPDGNYCVAGIAEIIYIWQIRSGKMLSSLAKHYQTVTTIKFTDDGSHFVSGGQDGLIIVWNLTNAISPEIDNQLPLYTISDHSLPVTDIYVGHFGIKAIVCSVSMDRILKIFDLSSGTLLLTLVFPVPLTVVTIDKQERTIFVGTSEGPIYTFSIENPPRMKEYHLIKNDISNFFKGHEGSVTCLSLSLDGEHLLSGGVDEKVLFWHIQSKQLIRTLAHKGAITNAFFTIAPRCMFDQEIKLDIIINNFQRMIDNKIDAEDHVIEVMVEDNDSELGSYSFNGEITSQTNNNAKPTDKDQSKEVYELKKELTKLKQINKDLFEFNVKKILKNKAN